MSYHPSHQDMVTYLMAIALGQARIAYDQLFNAVIPLLAPQRRLFAEEIMYRLTRGNLFDEGFLRDLGSLIEALKREVADGTQIAWIADEHDSEGGHHVQYLDHRALALACALDDLGDLSQMIGSVLNAVKAAQLSDTLMLD